jgi:hypothetical protein
VACACMGACMHMCMGACMGMCMGACLGACMDVCMGACMGRCMGACLGACMDMCMGACMGACMDVYGCVYGVTLVSMQLQVCAYVCSQHIMCVYEVISSEYIRTKVCVHLHMSIDTHTSCLHFSYRLAQSLHFMHTCIHSWTFLGTLFKPSLQAYIRTYMHTHTYIPGLFSVLFPRPSLQAYAH